jgi:hypothetical protein
VAGGHVCYEERFVPAVPGKRISSICCAAGVGRGASCIGVTMMHEAQVGCTLL